MVNCIFLKKLYILKLVWNYEKLINTGIIHLLEFRVSDSFLSKEKKKLFLVQNGEEMH